MNILNAFLSALIVLAVIVDRDLFSHTEQEQLKGGILLLLRREKIVDESAETLPTIQEMRRMHIDAKEEESE